MVLLTGATGFTGQRLLPRLLQRAEPVRVFVRPTSDRSTLDEGKVDVVVGDLCDSKAVRSAMDGVQRVVHLAHIRFAPQLLQEISRAFEHMVALSSLRLMSTVSSSSVGEVAQAEQEVRRCQVPCTILRPSMIFGANDRSISRMAIQLRRFRWVPVFGDGRALAQPVYVDDVVAAALTCLERPDTAGKTYALAGPRPLSFNDIVTALGIAVGVRPRRVRIPVGLALAGLSFLELAGLKAPVTAEQVRRSQEDKVFSIEEARSDLGFAPIEFDDALTRIYRP